MMSMKFVFATALAVSGAFAQAQANPAEAHIASAFIENLVSLQSGICSKRDPGAKGAWAVEVQAWKARHQETLASLRQSVEAIEARGAEFATLVVAAHSQATVIPLMMMATANDAEAVQTCSQLLKNLSDLKANEQMLAEAKAAAAAVLARAGGPR